MTAVTLACPLCAGNIQVDSSLAGQQVACPLCHGALLLPPAEVLAQFAGQSLQPPAHFQQPGQEQLFTLACPACANPLQVTAALSGHQVGCPFCSSPIVVPPLPGVPPQQQLLTKPAQPEPQPAESQPDLQSLLPPGADFLPPAATPSIPQPAKPVPPKPREPSAADRLPPTQTAPPPKTEAPPPSADRFPPGHPARQAAPPANDRFPPGFGGSKPREESPRVEKPAEQRKPPTREDRLPPLPRSPQAESPPEPKRPREPKKEAPPPAPDVVVDDLLPPGALPLTAPLPAPAPLPPPVETSSSAAAEVDTLLPPGAIPAATASTPLPAIPQPTPPAPAASPIDHLLPPGATEVNTAAVGRPTAMKPGGLVDALLPPGATTDPAIAASASERPLPKTQGGPLRPVLAPARTPARQGAGGLQVKGDDKEEADADVQAKKLSAQEKSRRRFRRNLIMWSLCVLILLGVLYFMTR